MKTILCPVDFSEASISAMEFATRLAEILSASVDLLHVVTEKDLDSILEKIDLDKSFDDKVDLIRAKLEKIISNIHEEIDPGLSVHYTLKEGQLIPLIIETENDKYIDLIVMGTKGVTNLAESYFGSNTLQVVQRASCPVLCIPGGAPFNGIGKIVYAFDYQEEDIHALNEVINLGVSLNANVEVLHIENPDKTLDENERTRRLEMTKYFDSLGVNFINKSFNGSVHEGISEYVTENNTDLLTLLKKKRNFIEDMFHKSITRYFAYYTDIPVLIFKY